MREITVKLYKFDELDDRAKEKARDWYREACAYDNSAWTWETVQEDAKGVGLTIRSLDQHRANSGHFTTDAGECARAILANHGAKCETYKTAKAFLEKQEKLVALLDDRNETDAVSDELEEVAEDFLNDILEDYRVMLEEEIEYQNSDEQVDESIRANEYEFTEDGRRS